MKIIIPLVIFFTTTLHAECFKVETKIIFDSKPVLTKETICTIVDADKMLFYVSKSCEDNSCDILKKAPKKIVIKNYYQNLGSPGFKLCEALGGVPQIYEFKKSKAKQSESTDRCLFGKQDFVEISYLSQKWKSFISN